MMLNCQIEFRNNPLGTYFAGQLISGSVTLNIKKPKQVKAVILQINGFASTIWTNSATNASNEKAEELFSGHEDYIRSKVELISRTNGTEIFIKPGSYDYNFACQLPAICPSSFEGTHGHVRYLVQVSFIRPWKFDQTFSRAFTVLKVMDLNREGHLLRSPTFLEEQKTYNCWPCNSEPLRLRLALPQRGYVPGQTIPVEVMVTNNSNIRVRQVIARLVMLVLYYSEHSVETISERFVISTKTSEGVCRNSIKLFTFDLQVPATPPSCFDLCRFIQIAYQVQVQTKVEGWHTNESVHLPVTIGNVPLTELLQQQPRSNSVEIEVVAQQLNENALVLVEDFDDDAVIPAINPWAIDSTIPPPSYAEAIYTRLLPEKSSKSATKPSLKGAEDAHNGVERAFSPLYAVFNIPSPLGTQEGRLQDTAAGGLVNEDIDRSTWF